MLSITSPESHREGVLALRGSTGRFLEEVARRGSPYGGGSVAALTAAAACALLEKLINRAPAVRKLRQLRLDCLKLVERDAAAFAAAMNALRAGKRALFVKNLKKAIEVPFKVFASAHIARALAKAHQKKISKPFQSDLRCALALTEAAIKGSEAFVAVNLSWLSDKRYAVQIKKRMHAAAHPHVG